MTAAQAVADLGIGLIGRHVRTIRYGEWTGGTCEVIGLLPDPNAPEIVFEVRRISDGEEIGVFGHEPVTLLAEAQP